MSDAPQGPGWWLGQDGKYYPPTAVPGALKAQPPKKKDVPIGGVIAFVAIFGCGGLFLWSALLPKPAPSTSPSPTTLAAAGATTTSPGGAPTTTAVAAPTTIAWAAAPPTMDSVVAELRSQKLDPSRVTVNGGDVVVQYKPSSTWDENTAVQKAGDLIVDTARVLFTNPAVTSVNVAYLADFTDQYGKSTEEVAIQSTVGRATADKITWDGLKDRVRLDGSDWFCIADSKVVHPGLLKNVESKRGLIQGVPCR